MGFVQPPRSAPIFTSPHESLVTHNPAHTQTTKNPFTQKNKDATIKSEETESEGSEFNVWFVEELGILIIMGR